MPVRTRRRVNCEYDASSIMVGAEVDIIASLLEPRPMLILVDFVGERFSFL